MFHPTQGLKETNISMKTLPFIFSALFVLCSGCKKQPAHEQTTDKFTVGLVFDVGGRGDKSFNDAAYRGLEKAKNELDIKYEYIEQVQGADREASLRQLSSRKDISLV